MYPEIMYGYPTQYEIQKYIELGKKYREELLEELKQEKNEEKQEVVIEGN